MQNSQEKIENLQLRIGELNEREFSAFEEVSQSLEENGDAKSLAGIFVDVDVLQLALENHGYEKALLGRKGRWYRNIISNSGGYIAELRAIAPDTTEIVAVVNAMGGEPLIIGIDDVSSYDN
ncbi:MAG: hypothetical protein ACOCQR_02350 [bacterium]